MSPTKPHEELCLSGLYDRTLFLANRQKLMKWTGWIALFALLYVTFWQVMEFISPGSSRRHLIQQAQRHKQEQKEADRILASQRRLVSRRKKTSWFGDIWFQQAVLWMLLFIGWLGDRLFKKTLKDIDRQLGLDD